MISLAEVCRRLCWLLSVVEAIFYTPGGNLCLSSSLMQDG